MKKNTMFDNIMYMVGSIAFGFTSFIFLILITRIIGIEQAGRFTITFAVACTFYAIGTYVGKTYQVSDISNSFNDSDYIYNRLITCVIMICITFIYGLLNGYIGEKLLLIILLTIYRGSDAFVETYHSIVQKKDRLYKVGLSIFVRTVLLIIIFGLSLILTKSLIASVSYITLFNVLYILIVDYTIVKNHISFKKFSLMKNNKLLLVGLPICLFSFLNIYITSESKFAIEQFTNDSVQGIFGIIFMPSSFVSLLALYFVHTFLNDFTKYIKNNNYNDLTKKIVKISIIILLVGLVGCVIAYFVGIPLLEIVYGTRLDGQVINLILIILGAILYSISSLLINVYVVLRKTVIELFILFIGWISSILITNSLVGKFEIVGASYAYLITMILILLMLSIGYIIIVKNLKKEKKIAIRLMGGLGNQMFEYAFMRNQSLNNNLKGTIDLCGITNKTHNVYGLDHCNISKDVTVVDKTNSFKGLISYLLYGLYCVFFDQKKAGFKLYNSILNVTKDFGIICIPDGYMKVDKLTNHYNYAVGYFQAFDYFKENEDIIREELQIKDKLNGINKKTYDEIKKSESVCVHIRRGDYVGSFYDVCDEDYYYKGIKEIKKKKKNINIYVFSDDIEWVKNNMTFDDKVTYIDWKNNQYEDLKLMSACKNFVMSNSSFSYWAQFLSMNKDKVVVAPSKWFRNNKKVDIYDERWILVKVKGE